LQTLSAKFTAEFGRGFSHRNLGSIVRFAEIFPNAKALILLEDLLKGEFGIVELRLDQAKSLTTPT